MVRIGLQPRVTEVHNDNTLISAIIEVLIKCYECSMGMFTPPEDRVSEEGFIEKVLCMPSLEEWIGFIRWTRRKGIPGRWMSTGRGKEG